MKHHMNFRWLTGLLFIFPVVHIQAQSNLIVNGDFAGDSGWNELGLYNEGKGTRVIGNGACVITITAPGTEVWSVQFTQNRIALDSGTAYTFSYEISSSINRTVEVSLSRDGGDYMSYSGRDTVLLASEEKKVEKYFVMKQPNDQNVRVEFNCGKAIGTVTIKNVKLVKNTTKMLSISKPKAGELLYAGVPYTVTWSSLNIDGALVVEVSVDNGSTWKKIGTTKANAGRFTWLPEPDYSPWCRVRVTSENYADVSAINDGPFELAPGIDLVKNGFFDEGDRNWFFGRYSGDASGEVSTTGEYHLAIVAGASEPWQIKLSQNGISLDSGAYYRLTFIAYAKKATNIDVNVGMDREPFTAYFDTTKRTLALTSSQKLFDFTFLMSAASDTGARLEFNCGTAQGDVFIDQVSLTKQYVASAEVRSLDVQYGTPVNSRVCVVPVNTLYAVQPRIFGKAEFHGVQMVNLLGRRTDQKMESDRSEYLGRSGSVRAAGVYLIYTRSGKRY